VSFDRLKTSFDESTPGAWDFVVADNANPPHCKVVNDSGNRVLAELDCVDPQDQANTEFIATAHNLMPAIINAVDALQLIRSARDHHAEHGEYPAGFGMTGDQCFDDRAADIAAAALGALGSPAQAARRIVHRNVCVEAGIPEDDQQGSFQNATLQGAGDNLAFSIATHLDIPDEIAREGEGAVASYITEQMARVAAAGVPGLRFTVQIGASRDAASADRSSGEVPMLAIVTGTFFHGMTIDRIVPTSEAVSIIDDMRETKGQMAQVIPIDHPSVRDKSLKGATGDVFVFFSGGSPGDGITAFGPFPDEDAAESFGEAHRDNDGEYSVVFNNQSAAPKPAPRG
jgi:hypothetical protein